MPEHQHSESVTRQLSSMAATASLSSTTFSNPNFTSPSHRHQIPSLSPLSNLKLTNSQKTPIKIVNSQSMPPQPSPIRRSATAAAAAAAAASGTISASATSFHGVCYVVGDNIDTDQIIPAEYLTLVPSNPEEYKKIGSYALIGLPASYHTRFIQPGEFKSKYSILIAGDNFGCGSSREHAPVALGAAGVAAVVAESYARIFFRNSVSTGEVYPLESETRVCEECKTGDVVTIELEESFLINHTTGKEYKLKPIGDAGPVIEAGGIFAYARKVGMIASRAA